MCIKNRRGFADLLIAVGIVSMLGLMSLSMQMTSGMVNRKLVQRLNATESFYAGEMATWHGYYRLKENLSVEGSTAVALDNDPYADMVSPICLWDLRGGKSRHKLLSNKQCFKSHFFKHNLLCPGRVTLMR